MPKEKMEINIDITDWNEEYVTAESNVSDKEAIIELAKKGVKPSQMGRLVIVARERGETEKDIIPPPKSLLVGGAAVSISQMYANEQRKVNLENGKEITVRRLTCATPAVETQVVVESNSKDGIKNAEHYLLNTLIGHAIGRLNIIAENHGDPMAIWDMVDVKVRNIIKERLVA